MVSGAVAKRGVEFDGVKYAADDVIDTFSF